MSNPKSRPKHAMGFARVDMVFTLIGLALLLGVTLPLIAGANPRSELALCMNNLRQLGLGLRAYADQHDDRFSWSVEVAYGGTMESFHVGNAWLEFTYVSNYLDSPNILICPSDSQKIAATAWGGGSGGMLSPTHRANSVSYFIGLHSTPENPQALVSGDRNLAVDSTVACNTGINNAVSLEQSLGRLVGWTNSIHGRRGNLLIQSGEVRLVRADEFHDAAVNLPGDADPHLLIP